jgi:hypothetical protein
MRQLLLTALSVALVGCQDNTAQIAELQSQLKQHSETIQSLQVSVAVLEAFQEKAVELPDAYGVIDCTTPAYDLVRTRLAVLTVSCREATKYLDGFKLSLQVGNPSSARLEGLKFIFTPTAAVEKGERDGAKPKTITRDVTNSFPPGSWTNVEVALPGLPEPALRGLQVRVEVDRIRMAGTK